MRYSLVYRSYWRFMHGGFGIREVGMGGDREATGADGTVVLTAEQRDRIGRLLKSGRYRATEDVIGESLRVLEEQEHRIANLRAAIIEGEESGPAEAFDFEEFLQELHAEMTSNG